jgi:preprotein translocase subunit SecE
MDRRRLSVTDKKIVHQQPSTLKRLYTETVGELRKVNWPTRQEAINLTGIVLLVIIAMSALLGLLDIVFAEFFALLLNI